MAVSTVRISNTDVTLRSDVTQQQQVVPVDTKAVRQVVMFYQDQLGAVGQKAADGDLSPETASDLSVQLTRMSNQSEHYDLVEDAQTVLDALLVMRRYGWDPEMVQTIVTMDAQVDRVVTMLSQIEDAALTLSDAEEA